MEVCQRVEVTDVLTGDAELAGNVELGGAAQAAVTHRVGGGNAGGAFPPRIRLPPQGTSLGLCEPHLEVPPHLHE
jgi:hypothetical protein